MRQGVARLLLAGTVRRWCLAKQIWTKEFDSLAKLARYGSTPLQRIQYMASHSEIDLHDEVLRRLVCKLAAVLLHNVTTIVVTELIEYQ